MPEPRKQPAARADRILDAAGALLLRLGYRKVTIEDIANQAGIGKGTVYLHWRTKEQLFEALLLRESIDLVEELVDYLRDDPAAVVPHRLLRVSYLATLRRPLITALVIGDAELLGALRHRSLRSQELLAAEQFFASMTRRGLLRDDVANLPYALQATMTGFYLIDTVEADIDDLDPEAKADALAHTIRHAFEPAGDPDPEALAATASELCTSWEDLIVLYRKWIYSSGPAMSRE